MQPERQTLAVNLNPNRSLEITCFDHDFLCLQPVLLGAASKSFHYIFNKMYLEYNLLTVEAVIGRQIYLSSSAKRW